MRERVTYRDTTNENRKKIILKIVDLVAVLPVPLVEEGDVVTHRHQGLSSIQACWFSS